jgi:hypothetical protein
LPRMCSAVLGKNWLRMAWRIDASVSTLAQVLLWSLNIGLCSQIMTCCLRML